MKTPKPLNKGLRKMKEELDDFSDVPRKSKAKKPKRVRREDFESFDQENDNLDDNDVYLK